MPPEHVRVRDIFAAGIDRHPLPLPLPGDQPCPACSPRRRSPSRVYRGFAVAASYLQSPLLLAMRVVWGYQFFIAGKGKLGNLDGVTSFFESLGIVAPKLNAIVASSTECFGGLLLLVGLCGRLISLPLAFTMLVAYWTAHHDALYSVDGFVAAAPFPFLVTSLVVLAFGPGPVLGRRAAGPDRVQEEAAGHAAADGRAQATELGGRSAVPTVRPPPVPCRGGGLG